MLGLRLVARRALLQEETAEGLLLTTEQEAAERRLEQLERRRAEEEWQREAKARVRAEKESSRLCAELERYRAQHDPGE